MQRWRAVPPQVHRPTAQFLLLPSQNVPRPEGPAISRPNDKSYFRESILVENAATENLRTKLTTQIHHLSPASVPLSLCLNPADSPHVRRNRDMPHTVDQFSR